MIAANSQAVKCVGHRADGNNFRIRMRASGLLFTFVSQSQLFIFASFNLRNMAGLDRRVEPSVDQNISFL